MIFFSLGSISISAERDCSNPKGFHNKLMCKKLMQKTIDTDNTEDETKNGFLKIIPKFLREAPTKKTLF